MTSITLDLFSGKNRPVIPISVPVVSLDDYHNRLSSFVIKRTSQEAPLGSRNNIVCREIFQAAQNEVFFLPYFRGKNISLENLLSGKLFFLRGVYRWNFILIFTPEDNSKGAFCFTQPSKFTQEDTYPEGASRANPFSFAASCASILVSEYGCIAKNSEGQLFFRGITVSLLQTLSNKGRSIFVQKRDIFASPSPPLREEDLSSLEPRSCKFIKISCFGRQEGFVHSTHFPVLTPEELQEKLRNNRTKRLEKYGEHSIKYKVSETQQTSTETDNSQSVLIACPPLMEVNVPFGSCRGGELFFSYSDQSSLTLQLIFFPNLFNSNQLIPKKQKQCSKNWRIGNAQPLIKHCNARSATVFYVPCLKLVSSSASEYKITGGMKIELVSAPRGSCWGVFFSPEKKVSLSVSSSNSTESINSPERHIPLDSPTPGISGIGYSEPAVSSSQPTATVSVPPERQGKQTQQRRNPVLEPSSVRHHPYPHGPLPFCGGRFPIIPHSQATATVSVLPDDRQGQQTRPVPGPSGIRHQMIRPIPIRFPEHGTWPFSEGSHHYSYPETGSFVGGFYPYGSPLPPYPHPSARQGQWVPVFPTSFSAIRPPVAVLEPLRYDIFVQEGVGQSERAEEARAAVPVGAVQQAPIWRPYEESSSAVVPPHAQEENFSEETG